MNYAEAGEDDDFDDEGSARGRKRRAKEQPELDDGVPAIDAVLGAAPPALRPAALAPGPLTNGSARRRHARPRRRARRCARGASPPVPPAHALRTRCALCARALAREAATARSLTAAAEYLVKWRAQSHIHAEWTPEEYLRDCPGAMPQPRAAARAALPSPRSGGRCQR